MAMVINFFRNRNLERFDYADLFLHFEELPNCVVTTDDEQVMIVYHDELFNLKYPFYITKRSRVSNIYSISAQYVNIRFLVEIPEILPEPVSRQVLSVIDNLCHKFQFDIYYEGANDAEAFDMLKMMKVYSDNRQKYIEQNPECEYFTLPSEVITHMCNYQQLIPFLKEKIKEDIHMAEYVMLAKQYQKETYLTVDWEVGQTLLFPPHLDYVRIIEFGEKIIVPANVFFKFAERFMYELKNYLPNQSLLMLTSKGLKKVTKRVKKMKKYQIEDSYKEISIIQVIEN
jgi:hypothetical protein